MLPMCYSPLHEGMSLHIMISIYNSHGIEQLEGWEWPASWQAIIIIMYRATAFSKFLQHQANSRCKVHVLTKQLSDFHVAHTAWASLTTNCRSGSWLASHSHPLYWTLLQELEKCSRYNNILAFSCKFMHDQAERISCYESPILLL